MQIKAICEINMNTKMFLMVVLDVDILNFKREESGSLSQGNRFVEKTLEQGHPFCQNKGAQCQKKHASKLLVNKDEHSQIRPGHINHFLAGTLSNFRNLGEPSYT